MAANIKALKNRIKSVDSTLHLTKAMGLVASSKIRKANLRMAAGRQYREAICNVVDLLSVCPECSRSPYLRESKGQKTKLIVIAGDRGLAGGYNANIFRTVRDFGAAKIIPIGKRACERYGGEVNSSETFSAEDAIELSRELCKQFYNGEFDRLGIVSTKYVSMMTQTPEIIWVLPLKRAEGKKSTGAVFEPDAALILETAVVEIHSDGVTVCKADERPFEINADSVILSVGYNPAPLATKGRHVHVIGDASKVGNLRTVIWGAWDVCMKL